MNIAQFIQSFFSDFFTLKQDNTENFCTCPSFSSIYIKK